MEYITAHLTPSPVRGWVLTQYLKTSMPTAQGHPRTLRTYAEVPVTGLRGVDVGTAAAMFLLHTQSLGTLPLCARCEAALVGDQSL